ncbi:cytochrome c biogenesis heme-transporting ATPase CcmA [Candidatus Symbiobacter mobilis]|uniref:Heme exporter protein A n=1 Tax=Candidatus Symbiobacter mobilis CR TaxID=946483 RepID=U5NCW9_9BURK|nr:cytochrome c biogenesis heme-transporting ATPase CcmA [Candidatus Symbiobacter mobilis]AGX88014.1 heme exporter protein A [Candidatus Symbiobacter mobilis CR]
MCASPSSPTDSASPVLQLCALRVVRGGRQIVEGLNLTLHRGEWLHVHGSNGAGKTTLLRTLCALYPAASGQVCWNGAPVQEWGGDYGRCLQYLGHAHALHASMTPQENLAFCAAVRGMDAKPDAVLDALDRLGVRSLAARQMRTLSQGQQRRVALAALLLEPSPLWVLDEPGASLDAAGRTILADLVREHLRGGGLVVGTGHEDMAWGTPSVCVRLACAEVGGRGELREAASRFAH